jgi:hypothetical protein
MLDELLKSLNPDADCLLAAISKHISDKMLESISMADYGQDTDQHFGALRQIRDTHTFPGRMYWYPAEVLELTRNSQPDSDGPTSSGESGYWMRAFCCVALLRATREPYNYGDGIATDNSLINLILSLHALPINFTIEANRFLAWLLLNSNPEGNDEQVCAYGIGLLWFSLLREPPVSDRAIVQLIEWIERRAKELYASLVMDNNIHPLRMGVGNPPPSSWGLLGVMLCELDLGKRSAEIQASVKIIGERLAE